MHHCCCHPSILASKVFLRDCSLRILGVLRSSSWNCRSSGFNPNVGLRKCWLYRWLPCLVLLIQALQNVKSSYKHFSADQKSVRKGVFVIRNNATDIPVASFLFLNATVIIIIIVGIITIVIIITRNNATDLFYFYIPVASLLFLNAVIFLIIVVSLVSWSYKLDLNKYKEFNISILRLLQNGKHGGQGNLVGKCCWWWWLQWLQLLRWFWWFWWFWWLQLSWWSQWLWWLWLRRGGGAGEAVGGRVTSDTMEQLVGLKIIIMLFDENNEGLYLCWWQWWW